MSGTDHRWRLGCGAQTPRAGTAPAYAPLVARNPACTTPIASLVNNAARRVSHNVFHSYANHGKSVQPNPTRPCTSRRGPLSLRRVPVPQRLRLTALAYGPVSNKSVPNGAARHCSQALEGSEGSHYTAVVCYHCHPAQYTRDS